MVSKGCNVAEYLKEQEVTCRDIAIVVSRNASLKAEWLRVAGLLEKARSEHEARCASCK